MSTLFILLPTPYGWCVSSPINELVTTIQKAQTGLEATTGLICLNEGEGFTSRVLEEQVSNVDYIFFNCKAMAFVCWGEQVSVATSEISALVDARFRAKITCTHVGYHTENFGCEITIIDD